MTAARKSMRANLGSVGGIAAGRAMRVYHR